MPGTTPNLDLPYPLAAEPWAIGNENIQDLAEALDEKMHHYLRARRTALQTLSDGVATEIQWTAASSAMSADFDLTNGAATDSNFTYLGPDRFIMMTAIVQFELMVSSGNAHVSLQRSAGATAPANFNVRRDFSDLNSANPISVGGLVWAETGDVFRLLVTNNTGSDKTIQGYLNAKVIL